MIIRELVVLAAMGVGALLLFAVSDTIRYKLGYGNEVSRKLVHSIHGVYVAIVPFVAGYWAVYLIELAFFLAMTETRKLRWFRRFWRVGRKSWGEYWYPVGVVAAALLAHSKWIFLAGVLELALADAAAALVGKKYGAKMSYHVFGQGKSVPGTAAFLAVSIAIFGFVLLGSPAHFAVASWDIVFALAIILAFVENSGVYGFDNLLLPVVSVLLLNALA